MNLIENTINFFTENDEIEKDEERRDKLIRNMV